VKAVSLPQPKTIHLIETPDPKPGHGEVVIRIIAAGVCANDVALIAGNNSIGKFPIIPGHECIGIIESVGPNVSLEPGTWNLGHGLPECRLWTLLCLQGGSHQPLPKLSRAWH
jgi:D-arabinose 1-dehydrogenase-like Zn-dependent alcohol dehydrogenase